MNTTCSLKKLIKKRKSNDEPVLYYVAIEDTYDVTKRAYIATGHGGRDRMIKETAKKHANVTREALELFKSYCEECQKKRKQPVTKGVVVQPIMTDGFSSHSQVDLTDMQSMAQGSYKWNMVYQDHITKFCVLRLPSSKHAAEVAHHLTDILLLLGAPYILQSDNGSVFAAKVISELKIIWPKLVLNQSAKDPWKEQTVTLKTC
ncbi:KRAB-A domain-containing protein 2-like [Penaeus indicus]|uniref:KRAB-A domain-containing protein 2-like n=1 Tax=Penaeus indicus TaxID=29960 RepID=UPI00300C524B